MTEFLYRLGRRCAENGWRVIGIWFLIAIVVMGANRLFGGESADSFVLKGTDSSVAQNLLNRAFPGTSAEAVPIVLYDPSTDFTAPNGERIVDEVVAELRTISQVSAVESPASRSDLVSDDGHTAIVSITVNERFAADNAIGEEMLTSAQAAAGPDVQVALGGFIGAQISQPETHLSEALGLLSAVFILFLTLRRWGATFVPLASALFSVGLGLALVGLLSRLVFIPDVAPTLGTMLGLGVGIDYALFLLTRHRTLLHQGYNVPDAVGRTAGTAGAGMVFAGGTLIAAVCGLVLTGISFLAWLGYAAAIVVAIAVLASITLVPAILGVMKHRVLPKKGLKTHSDEDLDHTGWGRLADAVTSKPWRYAIGSTAVLLILAAPTVTLTLGHSDAGYLPKDTTARQAYDLVEQGFGPGDNGPFAVVTQMYAIAEAPEDVEAQPGSDPRTQDPRLQNLQEQLAAAPGVASAGEPVVSPDGGVAVVRVVPEWGPADTRTEQLVHDLRDTTLPAAVQGEGMGAHLGGVTAATTDFSEIIASRTPFFIAGVVTLSFLLLMLAYRSLLIPFKAACMNLISIAAAYGVVTMVFQWGWGAELIGLDGPVPIESYVPMMMFAVLFGLSMDYEVFLLTAFREHWERTGDMTTAVRRGLADTGRLVTAAALIMVVVFGSFLLSENATVKMFGVGLATAVAVDATIVRCLLVPAIMVLAQKGTWWLPDWLDRLLPPLHVEGDPRALDAAAAGARQRPAGRTPLAVYRPAPVIGAVIGGGLSWVLTSRLSIIPQSASTAVAMSAVLGAVLALLPRTVGGVRGTYLVRAAGYALGVVLALLVVSAIDALVPPASAPSAPVTAWAIVATSLFAVLVVGRSVALPMVLGSVSMAVTYLLSGPDAGLASLLAAALLPALVTILIISVFDNLFPPRHDSMESDRAEEPEPIRVGESLMRRRPLLATVAAGVAASLAAVPVLAADPEAALVNEELVVAQVDASGLPVEATLYSRLVARDYPVGQVRDPSSTTEVTYIDRRGAPATDGDAVLVDIGGNGQTTVTTRAAFDKPLPVALHAEYRQGPRIVAPDDVPDTQGQMRIVYTVTNTTASEQTIRYRDAAGRWTVEKQPVFAPFVGTMVATLPQGLTLIEAPKAVRNTTEEGRTQLQWNLVLYPPIGDFQQSVQMLVSGDPLEVPGLTMQVIPVQSGQSPQLGFSTDLLASSVKGSAELAEGLVQLDKSAVALAQGAGNLSNGLRQLGRGTSVLSKEVNDQLVPGSQQLADGADKLAEGQSDAAKGTSKLAKGQQDAADGTEAAYDGAKSLEEGAAQLSDGLLSLYDGLQELLQPTALPSARDSADQLAQAVLRLRDVIGEPSDPTVQFPPTQANSLLQAIRATQRTSGLTAAGAAKVTGTLKDIAKELADLAALSAQAATLAGSAEAQTALVYQQACVDAVVLTPAQCAALQQATTDAGQARQQAADVGVGVGQQAARTGTQALAVGVIATSLKAITAALVAIDTGLTQVSLALVSGSTQTPGVYEGLQALTDGLSATIDGLVALSNGTAESAGGAQEITTATGDLTDGLGELADGAEQLAEGAEDLATGSADLAEGGRALADGTAAQAQGTAAVGGALNDVNSGVNDAAGGAQQLAEGADQLQQQGTSDALAGVIKASKQPAFAKAYLAATQARADDALPYGAPEGAVGRVAYVYTMPGSGDSRGSTGKLAGWGLLAVIAAAAGAVAWRRLHPVAGTTGDVPGAVEEKVPGAEQVAFAPPPGATPPDDDWPFRP